MIKIKFSFKLSKLISLSVFLSVLCFREKELFAAYSAALLHEGAHAAVCLCLGVRPSCAEVGIFGIGLKIPYVTSSIKRIIIAAAGPLMSFLLFGYLYTAGYIFSITYRLYNFFVFANFCIGFINLLPLSPLDGGAILKAALAKYLGIINGSRVYATVSAFFCVFFACVGIILGLRGVFNPWFMLILTFVCLGARKEKILSIREKKAVLSGEIVSDKKPRYIACDAESELLCLASRVNGDSTILAAAFCDERFYGELSQPEIIEGIKKYGALCTAREYIDRK